MIESDYIAPLLIRAPYVIPTLRLFRRQIMVARRGDRVMRAGVPGQADLYGYVQGGRCVEIELKGVDGRQSDEQRAWQAFCASWGVPYVLLRATRGEARRQTIERWCGELKAQLIGPG